MIKHLSSVRHKKSSNELKKFAEEEIQLSAISQIKLETNNNKSKKISTSICINEAKLHLKLLELFDAWNTNNDEELDIHEVVIGMYISGIKIANTKKICTMIYDISEKNQTTLNTLRNDEFVEFMLHNDNLGKETLETQFKVIDILKNGVKDQKLREKILKAKNDLQNNLQKNIAKDLASIIKKSNKNNKNSNSKWKEIRNTITKDGWRRFSVDGKSDNNDKNINITYDENALEREGLSSKCFCIRYLKNNGRTRLFLYFLLWWFGASLLYVYVNDWSFQMAFYYAIQAGFSIGFGSISEAKYKGLDTFNFCATHYHGSPSTTKNTISNNMIKELNNQLVNNSKYIEMINNAINRVQTEQLAAETETNLCATLYTTNAYSDLSYFYTICHLCLGAALISAILSLLSIETIEKSEAWHNDVEDDLILHKAMEVYKDRPIRLLLKKIEIWFFNHYDLVIAIVSMLLWILIGGIIFQQIEGGSFIQGLYFAFSAASTGGLLGPSGTNSSALLFTMFYCLIAVPLYANGLGQLSVVLTSNYISHLGKKKRREAITENEFNYICHLGDRDGVIDKYEFALLWFLRNGMCEPSHIQELKDDFDDLDPAGNGKFSKSNMQASSIFEVYDRNHDGELSAKDVYEIALQLQKIASIEYPGKFMLDPDVDYTIDVIKEKMKKFDKEPIVIGKKRISSRKIKTGKNIVNNKYSKVNSAIISLNRREFMRFWLFEFEEYIGNRKRSILAYENLKLDTLLKAIRGERV